ncbi:MAG: redoxin domain-containing protein [Bdellovibrionales bacterium]|nr:redoxin domain-containing protein [Bdellovibrionales bacterium]
MAATARIVGKGRWLDKKAPDFTLPDQYGKPFHFYEALKSGPHLLVFYPGDFTKVCTAQLCDYRDHMDDFGSLNVRIVGISKNPQESHGRFATQYGFSFPLLSDPSEEVAKSYGCRSLLMFGGVSRALAVVSTDQRIRYHYVESTVITRRTAHELLEVLEQLKSESKLT